MAGNMKYWIESTKIGTTHDRTEISLRDDTSERGTIFSITRIAPGRVRITDDQSESPFYRANLTTLQAIEALQEAIQWLKQK